MSHWMRRRNKRNLGRLWGSLFIAVVALAAIVAFAGQGGIGDLGATVSQGACKVLPSLGIECDLGTIPAGSSATVQLVVPAEAAGVVTDTVVVRGNEPDKDPGDNQDTEPTTVIGAVELVVTKSARPDPVVLGGSLTYTIDVFNKGPSSATEVVLEDKLPFGVTLESVSASQGSCSDAGRVVRCSLGTLPKGKTAHVTIVVVPEVIGFVTNTVCVSSREDDPCASVTTEIVPAEDPKPTPTPAPPPPPPAPKEVNLSVTKADQRDPVRVGDNIIYTITVTNSGPDDATGVTLSDSISFDEQK